MQNKPKTRRFSIVILAIRIFHIGTRSEMNICSICITSGAVVQACCTISIHTMMFDVVYRLVVCDYSPVRWIISPLLVRRKQKCSFGFFVLSMIIVIIIENMYDFLFVCENHFSRLLSESIRIVGLGIIPVKAFIAPNNGNEIYEQEIQFVSWLPMQIPILILLSMLFFVCVC